MWGKARDLAERERAETVRPRLHAQELNVLTLTRSVTTFQHMGFLTSGRSERDAPFVQTHTSLWCV